MREVFKRTLLAAALAICSLASAASLEQNVQQLEQIRTDIEAAIRDKDGTPRGGLANAAADIRAIPDKTVFEQSYVAWSNATETIRWPSTNGVYRLVEWLQSSRSQSTYINLGIYANQDTYVEIAISNVTSISTEHDLFGNRSGNMYGVHFFSSQVSFPYYNNWNDFKASATSSQTQLMVIKMDGNEMYVNGSLVFTASKPTFRTGGTLCVFTQNGNTGSPSYNLEGKVLWMNVKRAVDSENNLLPDMTLVPALGDDNKPCLLDIAASPIKPYYLAAGSVGYPEPTNTIYDITWNQFTAELPTPYETNIVDSTANKQVINDVTEYIYQRISDL